MSAPQVFIRRSRVEEITGLSTSTLYYLMKKNEFPQSVPITENRVGWVEAEVIAWQKSKIAARDKAA